MLKKISVEHKDDEVGGDKKEKFCKNHLEEVCGVDNDKDEEGGQVGGKELIDDPPPHKDHHLQTLHRRT